MHGREDSDVTASQDRLLEITLAFLRLGFIAFGGAVAHIALMEDEFVRRRRWLTREDFLDRVGAVNLLPGPSSTEMTIYLGHLRGGLPGLLLAGASFILPSAFLMCALAWAYLRYGAMPQLTGALSGVKPIVVVLIAQAVWSLAKTVLKSRELAFLSAVVLALASRKVPSLPLLIGTGVAWIAATRFTARPATSSAVALMATTGPPVSSTPAATGSSAFAAAAALAPSTLASVSLYFLKIGALLFGSGYVLLAVLREDLVLRLHWLSEAQLLDAVAVSQATPGPFFTVATFIGFFLHGWRGAALATAAMFVPAFSYVAITAGFLPRLRKSSNSAAFLDGVNAAAVALMAFVGFQFARAALVSPATWAIAAVAAILLFRYRLNSAWLVLGGAVAGLLSKLLTGT